MRIFFAQADNNGSAYYRSLLPGTALLKTGLFDVTCTICDIDNPALFESDIVVMQRQFEPYWFEIIKKGRDNGCKYIYEIDDDIFHLPLGLPNLNEVLKQAEGMIDLIKECDGIITTTKPLAELLEHFNKKVYILPNYIIEPDNSIPIKNENIKIGWSGSDSHCIDFDNYILNALEKVKQIYGDKIRIVFMGWIPQSFIGKATFFPYIEPRQYLTFLRSLNLEIGIIPVKSFPFNQSRSNLKYLEYSINKTATIASPVYPYETTILGDRGIIVKKNKYKVWVDALQSLIEDEIYRKTMAENAYNYVKRNYILQDNIEAISNLFLQIAKGE